MKAQYPSALDKQCSKHSTQLGARKKMEICKHQPAEEPWGLSFIKGQPMEPGRGQRRDWHPWIAAWELSSGLGNKKRPQPK